MGVFLLRQCSGRRPVFACPVLPGCLPAAGGSYGDEFSGPAVFLLESAGPPACGAICFCKRLWLGLPSWKCTVAASLCPAPGLACAWRGRASCEAVMASLLLHARR